MSTAPELPNLTSFSLSFTANKEGVVQMPSLPPTRRLESLHLTLSADKRLFSLDNLALLQSQTDFGCLLRLSVLNLVIGSQTLASLLSSAPQLEELYISVNGRSALLDCFALSQAKLRVFHVNAPAEWAPTLVDLTALAKDMSELEEIGVGNRVYEISRRYDNNLHIVELNRWSKTTTPTYFTVWRG